jgi:hypothetical protein
MGDIISAERIDENIKRMHIVLIGINELTDALLKFIANDMTTKLPTQYTYKYNGL